MGKLIEKGLKRLIEKPGRYADGGGLFFKTVGQGRAYWTFRYSARGKGREMSLGPYPELSLDAARIKHLRLVADVRENIDPLAGKNVKGKTKFGRQELAGVPTFGQLAIDYVETHESAWRSSKHRTQWRQTLTQHCLPIWSKPIDQIATADVLACLKPVWSSKQVTAARLRGRIETVIDAARALGHIDEDKANPARWKGHLDHLLPKPKKLTHGHHAAMPYAEVAEFVARLRLSHSMAALALQLLVLTATRTNETLGARWGEIDRDKAVWRIPGSRMKTKEEFDVPLSERALAVLEAARIAAPKEPTPESFVFPGARPKRPLSNMALPLVLRRMEVNATAHGFRTSFRTWASDIAHAEFEVAETCLSHRVGSAVSRAYNRTSMLERRRPIMIAWSRYICGDADSNVVQLRSAVTA
jgi:integrase